MQTNELKTEISQNFKIHDKVRVLKKDNDSWKTYYFGIITKLGDKFAYIVDLKKTEENLASVEFGEWTPFESKMLKVIKD